MRPLFSRLGTLVLLTLAPLAALPGCDALERVAAGAARPTASVRSAALQSLSPEGATLGLDVLIDNPNRFALPLSDLAYRLSVAGAEVASGEAELDGSVPANGSRSVRIPITVAFAEVLRAGGGVRPGTVVPYTASATLRVNAAGALEALGPIELPLETSGELPVPALPRVAVDGLSWRRLSLQAADATLRVRVENTNAFPIDVSRLSANVSLAGVSVGDARAVGGAAIRPGEAAVVELPLSFRPAQLGLGALNALRGERVSYALDGALGVGTPFGPIEFPLRTAGTTPSGEGR